MKFKPASFGNPLVPQLPNVATQEGHKGPHNTCATTKIRFGFCHPKGGGSRCPSIVLLSFHS
eukprot:scaffold532727_cov45-Prasinocladus_malaysianus.AAC.1